MPQDNDNSTIPDSNNVIAPQPINPQINDWPKPNTSSDNIITRSYDPPPLTKSTEE